MQRSMYISAQAANIAKQRLSILSNNIANTNTVGFKKDNIVVSIDNTYGFNNNKNGKLSTDFSQGRLRFTGDNLHIAIDGSGFFKVKLKDGSVGYTRRSIFRINNQKQLVTDKGYQLMGSGGPIAVESSDISLDEKGNIYDSKDNNLGKIQLFDFEDPDALDKIGGSVFIDSNANAGEIESESTVKQGYLEESNVDSVGEMLAMMDSLRNYETGQRVIQYFDQTLGKVINELGKG